MRAPRLTARGRLTVLYTALVLAAGLVLTGLTYLLMRGNLQIRSLVQHRTPRGPGPAPPEVPGLPDVSDQVRAEALSEFLTQSAVALTAVTLLAAGLSWWLAGRVLRPIRKISASAQRLSAEHLSERVPVDAPADDLARLAETINGMLDRIQQGIAERDQVLDSQRMFTANAAHELRTPLTTMRAAVDVTLDGEPTRAELLAMAGDIGAAIDQSQRTLDGLLALARSQAGLDGDKRPIDLAAVVAGALDRTSDEATARDLALRTDLRPAPILGEPILLERMASNLTDNAVRYNHRGGDIAVTTGTDRGRAFLRVTNTGRLIPPDEAAVLLEPFVRGDGSRTRADGGAGLGLSIVRAVVVAHGGEIATAAHPTGGLDITVSFPDPG